MRHANAIITGYYSCTGYAGDGSAQLSELAVPVPVPCSFAAPRRALRATLEATGVTDAQTVTAETARLAFAAPAPEDRVVARRDGGAPVVYVVVWVERDSSGDAPGAADLTTLALTPDADQSDAGGTP